MHLLLILILILPAVLFSTAGRALFAAIGWLLIGAFVFAVAGPVGLAVLVGVVLIGTAGRRRSPISNEPIKLVVKHHHTVTAAPEPPGSPAVDLRYDRRQNIWRA
jgi:hypothetical protein